jgi:putative ABC transport system permease protein
MPDRFTLSSIAFHNLRRRPLRTAILVAALTLMVAALVFALSFVMRVNESIRLTSDRLGADLLIVPTGARGAAETSSPRTAPRHLYEQMVMTGSKRSKAR